MKNRLPAHKSLARKTNRSRHKKTEAILRRNRRRRALAKQRSLDTLDP